MRLTKMSACQLCVLSLVVLMTACSPKSTVVVDNQQASSNGARKISTEAIHAARLPVAIRHEFSGPLQLSMPVVVTLHFDVPAAAQLQLVLYVDSGLMLAGDTHYEFRNDGAQALAYSLPVTITPSQEGKFYLGITAVLERDGGSETGSIAIALPVAP